MKKNLILLVLATLMFVACEQKENIQLPTSKFYNSRLDIVKKGGKLQLNQVGKDSINVIYGDSAIFKIDSNLHYNLFKRFETELNLVPRFNSSLLKFDQNTSIKTISTVLDELFKIDLRGITFLTSGNKGVTIRINRPTSKNLFYHPYVSENYIPHPKPPQINIDSLIADQNTLQVSINNSKINVNTNQNIKVDLKNEIFLKEQIFIIYRLDSTAKYQDLISIYDFVFYSITDLRKNMAILEGNLSEQAAKKKYPIRMLRI